MPINADERRLLEQLYDGGGRLDRGAPEDEAAYRAFEADVETLLGLRAAGYLECKTAPHGMRGTRKYYKAFATLLEPGRELVERLRATG